jgi:hypothetical protein
MKVGEVINHENFTVGHRPLEGMQELANTLRRQPTVWSWGAHAWTKMNQFCLRFMVQGHHHRGHVYLVVNGSDLFDAYLTTSRGTIKKIVTDIYIEDLISILDSKIERIDAYIR